MREGEEGGWWLELSINKPNQDESLLLFLRETCWSQTSPNVCFFFFSKV
jgi:hypothetical protein